MNWRRWATTTHGPAEAIAASFAFWWGWWVASPFWNAFDSTPTFRVMSAVAPGWGGLAMVSGLLLLRFSLTGNSAFKQSTLIFLVAFFAFVTFVLAAANYRSTALPVYSHAVFTFAFLWYSERRRNG